jgi:hypothetical protein
MRRPLRAVVAGALCGLVACGVPVDRDARVTPSDQVPYDLLSPTTTSVLPGSEAGQDTTVCLESEGALLAVGRDRRGAVTAESLLALVTAGPTEGEANLGLRNAFEEETIEAVSSSAGTATVELGEEFGELPGDQQLVAVGQVTCTLTAQSGITRVVFLLDGERIDVPVQGGSLVDRAVTRSDYERLYAN